MENYILTIFFKVTFLGELSGDNKIHINRVLCKNIISSIQNNGGIYIYNQKNVHFTFVLDEIVYVNSNICTEIVNSGSFPIRTTNLNTMDRISESVYRTSKGVFKNLGTIKDLVQCFYYDIN